MWHICFVGATQFFVFMDSEGWQLHYLVYLSEQPCRNEKRQGEKSTIFTFSLPLCSCLGRCVPLLFVYFGKEGPLSTCPHWVNGRRPDSCQLCPSTGCGQPSPSRPASTLCSPQLHHTWSNTVTEREGNKQLSSNYQDISAWYSLSIRKVPKSVLLISAGQENGMHVLYHWILRAIISIKQDEFLMDRLSESKNSLECLCRT